MNPILTTMTGMLTAAVAPTASQLSGLFKGLNSLPTSQLEAALALMDPGKLQKLAEWASEFVTVINDVAAIQEKPTDDNNVAVYTDDFFEAMSRVKFIGTRIEWRDIAMAHNITTKSLKAGNFLDGIMTGITLAGLLP